MLNRLDHIPDGLLALDATQLHDFLGGPTLIELQGRQQPKLFMSVLMHGNETTGWEALRDLLGQYIGENARTELPRALTIFIGNTEAAKHNVRHLPDQPDYNRVWPGSELPACAEHELMQKVVDIVTEGGLFASVDVHNNTGLNPHYACVNRLKTESLHLATLFNRSVVYFIRPTGVQSLAMSEYCPAVTLECGKVGNTYALQHTYDYLDACLHLNAHPTHAIAPHDIDLFHTTAIAKVPEGVDFGYHGEGLDLKLVTDLEHYNFRELSSGTPFGKVNGDLQQVLTVTNERGEDVFEQYFTVEDGVLRTNLPVMPSMLTPDTEVIRQDCLCYLMERFPTP